MQIRVNGETYEVEVAPSTPLLWVLRDHLGLKGTRFACGVGQCGACTVHLGPVAIRSCSFPVSAVGTQEITTIEGLNDHPLQRAWVEEGVPQCGYCQSGQIMAAAALLASRPSPTDDEIDALMSNICRCGTYVRIRRGIHRAAAELAPVIEEEEP